MKGQYFSFDAIIASVIFVLALVALLSSWHSVRSFLDYQNDQLSKDVVRISNMLFTPPEPLTTNCAAMDRLGFAFAWDDRRVDSSILDCAKDRDAQWLKEKTGSSFDVHINVTDLAEDMVEAEIGDPPSDDASDVVKIRRLATVVESDGSTHLAAFDLSIYK